MKHKQSSQAKKITFPHKLLWFIGAGIFLILSVYLLSNPSLTLDFRGFAKGNDCRNIANIAQCKANNMCEWVAKSSNAKKEDCSYRDCVNGVPGCGFKTKPNGKKVCEGQKTVAASQAGKCVMKPGVAADLVGYCWWGNSGYKVEEGTTVIGPGGEVYKCKGNNTFEKVKGANEQSADILPSYLEREGKCFRDGVVYPDGGIMWKNDKMQVCKRGKPVDMDELCQAPKTTSCQISQSGRNTFIICDKYGQASKDVCSPKQTCDPNEGCIRNPKIE